MESVLKKKSLAIICPVLNCLNYTKGFLQTIQSKTPYKIIMIDNASDDGTTEYLYHLKKNKQIILIANKRNEGVAKSWNDGIRLARNVHGCDTFFIPNNDILLKKCTIDRMVELLERPDIGMVTAYNVNGEINDPDKLSEYNVPILQKLTENPDFSCFMLNNDTIDKVGYFDENFWPAYFEDNDYHYRMKLAGLRAVKNNQSLYFHFGSRTVRDNANINKISNEHYLKNKAYFVSKWGGEPGNEIYETPFNVWEN